MSDDLAILVDHVTKDYHLGQERSNIRSLIPGPRGELGGAVTFSAIEDLTMEIVRGESLGIIGENGAGKSTILKMMARIIEPTRGSVTVNGRLSALIELGAAFEPSLTGAENVYFSCGLLGMGRTEIRTKFDSIVEFAGLQEFLEMPVKRYSTGMRARLGFAVATSIQPDVLIVDEVLSVGDFAFQRRSFERIRELHAGGATLVIVSHSPWMIEQLCNRLILLEHGKLVADGLPAEVMARYIGPDYVAETDPSVGAPSFERYHVTDHEPPAVTIDSMWTTPTRIGPSDPITITAEITVHRPTDGILVMAFFTSGRAVFAERDPGPSDFLRGVGTWTVTAEIDRVPINTGIYMFRFAILPEDSVDPDQGFETAIAVNQVEFEIRGSFTARPGVHLITTWTTDRQQSNGDIAASTLAEQQAHIDDSS